MTAAPDLAPALAALTPGQLERALWRRLIAATVDGTLDSPLLTQYPAETTRLVLDLVANVLMLKGLPGATLDQDRYNEDVTDLLPLLPDA